MSYNATHNVPQGAIEDYADAQLSDKFGPEITNYFSGSRINRVSFLRANKAFLSAALSASHLLLLNASLDPLSAFPQVLHFVPYSSVATLVGRPFELSEEEILAAATPVSSDAPLVVFLGLDEDCPSAFAYGQYVGQPYFAVHLVDPEAAAAAIAAAAAESKDGSSNVQWRRTRQDLRLERMHAAMFAHARSVVDWNVRNRFCSACGGRTVSVHAGAKRVCPPSLQRPDCLSRSGVHNIAFPRTDPTVIMAIVNSTGDKVLLGRKRRWPEHLFSCLAGFLEPGESIEDAVRREAWEESGVRVGRVVVHSSQPWPYPASLMIGCVGQALSAGRAEEIHLGHDPELHQAGWYPIAFVREMLARPALSLDQGPPEGFEQRDIRLPPATAIAHQLLLAVCNNIHGGLSLL